MMNSLFHYTKQDLKDAFCALGLAEGRMVFIHVSLGRLGYSELGRTIEDSCQVLLESLREVVGESGTIFVPTYTYSIGRNEVFDVQKTPSSIGEFTEFFRKQPNVVRSADPMLSVAGIGPKAGKILRNLPRTCYGVDSVYDRLYNEGALLLTIGLGVHWATCIHYIEEYFNIPFRFKKLFTGIIREDGVERRETWSYFAAPLVDNCAPNGIPLEKRMKELGVCRTRLVGRGEVWVIEFRDYRDFAAKEFEANPWLSAKGPPLTQEELIQKENLRVEGRQCRKIELSKDSSMLEIIEKLEPLERNIVSDGYDVALHALTQVLPMDIHEFPTGTECFTWIVPEKWKCKNAFLETLDGRRLFSYEDHPLHVVSYSLPFQGIVSREELLRHLHVHPLIPEAVPFIFKYYEKDWGLCCSQLLRDSLQEERYRVVIDTEFSYSTLKVGEVILPGESDESIVLCAHLCHPCQVNDDLSGVAVGIELMRRLGKMEKRHYTYRLLILPETIGSVAWLSHNESLIPKLKSGLFLEMLGRDNPLSFARSFRGDSEFDLCAELLAKESCGKCKTIDFLYMNDERQFNAPGIRVPMLAMYRFLPRDHPLHPYPEYHSNYDTSDRISITALEESVKFAYGWIQKIEKNFIPIPLFKGEVFCSRYGLHIDGYQSPKENERFFDILYHIDGVASVAHIAKKLDISFDYVLSALTKLKSHKLIDTAYE